MIKKLVVLIIVPLAVTTLAVKVRIGDEKYGRAHMRLSTGEFASCKEVTRPANIPFNEAGAYANPKGTECFSYPSGYTVRERRLAVVFAILGVVIAIASTILIFLTVRKRREDARLAIIKMKAIETARAEENDRVKKVKLERRTQRIGDEILRAVQKAWQKAGSPADFKPSWMQEKSGRYVIVLGGFYAHEFQFGIYLDLQQKGQEITTQGIVGGRTFPVLR